MRVRHAVAFAILCGCGLAYADTLQMTDPETNMAIEQERQAMVLPHKGMSMSQVEQQYGQPQRKLPAVGEPPISRWVYGDYTVYFEHQYVIHAVLNSD